MDSIGEFLTEYNWLIWLVAFFVSYAMINLKRDYNRRISFLERMMLQNTSYQGAIQKQKFKASERLILFLDRCEPAAIASRIKPKTDDIELYIAKLLKVIDEEFSHNITMQLYVHPRVWHKATEARDEFKQLINEAYIKNKTNIDTAHQMAPILYKIRLLNDSKSTQAKFALSQDIQQ